MACTFSLYIIVFFLLLCSVCSKEDKEKDVKDAWKKKDIRDYSEADMERLFDQWEDADDDELDEDELPEWKREPPKLDIKSLNTNDPEGMLKAAKKGRSLMLFASVSGNPTEKETEKITQIWQSSLFNANIETQRYVVGENRVIFMLKDGSMAWDVKDYLVTQDRCEEVTIEGKSYPGKASTEKPTQDNKKKKTKSKSKDKSKTDTKSSKDNKTKNKDKVKDEL
ncbi:Mesoderm development candidate 2 [Mactra antiquata]